MSDIRHPNGSSENIQLSSWLQQVMRMPLTKTQTPGSDDTALELLLDSNYHLRFYQQLPDFIMALLKNDMQAPLQYAELLYHLAGCSECHTGYLELYDALQTSVHPQGERPQLGQGTKTLAATPPRMLGHLCRVLISQAEALFREGRRNHHDYEARLLLQQALTISAHIGQSGMRQQALHDLVRVANLFEGIESSSPDDPHAYVYSPIVSGAGGMRGRKKIVRHVEAPQRSRDVQASTIFIQARGLGGRITQEGGNLLLHLEELAEELHGRYVAITVPLGALLEPVRWHGGNPRSIRSSVPVDAQGALTVLLGETELQLDNHEERSLLEAMFTLLEVHAVD